MKEAFVLCPIGPEDSAERKRSDKMLKHVFRPTLEAHGYSVVRADTIAKSGIITSQIIESDLVVADLTGGNPNVFYELAIRHASGKPYIQVIEKGESMPFDTSGVRTIQVDLTDPDSIESSKEVLGKQVEHFHAGHHADSPVSVAVSMKLLQSDTSYAERLFEKLDDIQGMGFTSIEDLDDKLREIEGVVDDIKGSVDEVKDRLG